MGIIDEPKKTVLMFELTVPGELRIEAAHKLKFDKYQHFETAVTQFQVKVIPFEIGSTTGYVSNNNKSSLTHLHKFCSPNIKLKKFIEHISVITILGSFYIFNARKEANWSENNCISAPFPNQ